MLKKFDNINVLSLFDGISCGQIALKRAGIKVKNYFASEIDKHTIKITMSNFPDTIQLGDVTKVKVTDLPKIDLLIGGSPCQGFSIAGKQLNFEDNRSKLFFEFHRLLKEVNPKYFLLENVKMKKEYINIISRFLGVVPLMINSSLITPQSRQRLYWTNIKNITLPDNNSIDLLLQDILEDDLDYLKQFELSDAGKKVVNSRSYGLNRHTTANSKCCSLMASNAVVVDCPFLKTLRKLTPEECEILQTVDIGYTSSVSNTQRYKVLGNGWTVDIIAHIFRHINEKFDKKIPIKGLFYFK